MKRKKARKKKKSRRAKPDKITDIAFWESLPEGLVHAISEKLPVVSVISMSKACKSWKQILASEDCSSQTRGLPWLMPCGQNDSNNRSCVSVLQNKVCEMNIPEACGRYWWGSIEDWLILVESCQSNSIKICCLNPFLNTQILLPETLDVYSRIVLSTSPSEKNCVILLISEFSPYIGCWTPEAKTWSKLYLEIGAIGDVVFCNGSFYFVNQDNDICIIEATTVMNAIKGDNSVYEIQSQCSQVNMPDRTTWLRLRLHQYLVESCGQVLLVCCLCDFSNGESWDTKSFEVFKLDVCQMTWIKMENLGDRLLFIGKCHSRSFSSKELGVDKGNCIYFLNDLPTHQGNEWNQDTPLPSSLDDWGVFSLDSNSFHPESCKRGNAKSWPPIWMTAPSWWYIRNTPVPS
ncbi:hypothetical protein ACHQM5_027549 [Ranunculus cassubicifolius]